MSWTWLNRWVAKVRADPVLREAYDVDECEALGRAIDARLAQDLAKVHALDDHRPFDVGTPRRCYRCGTGDGVQREAGEGGYVYACPWCPHPAD